MKKICFILIVSLLVIISTSCTFEINVPKNDGNNDFVISSESVTDQTILGENPTDNKLSENENEANTPSENEAEENKTEWRDFLKEYEAWVDEYVSFMKKYKANPTDLSLMADVAKLSAKSIEWSNKADKIQSDLSDADLNEYLQTMSRITQKLSEAAY